MSEMESESLVDLVKDVLREPAAISGVTEVAESENGEIVPEEGEPTAAESAPPPEWQVHAPEEVLREIEEDELEEQVETELSQELDEDEFADPALVEERKLRIKAEKRLKYMEEQRVKDGKKVWAIEAERYFPLAKGALSEIEARSRREFLRKAKAHHDALEPVVKEIVSGYEKKLSNAREEFMAELKTEASRAWGRPTLTAGSTAPPHVAVEREMEAIKARGGSLADYLKPMLRR